MDRPAVLILAGGSGTRFWPASRRLRPKQLLALGGARSLIEETFERLRPFTDPERVWIVTTQELLGAVAERLPEVPRQQILAEPQGRNTAPAIGWALQSMPAEVRQGVVVVLPADHRVRDAEAFRAALDRAARAAEGGRVVTLGIRPRRAETGFGYLEIAEETEPNLRRVVRFTEKPDAATAERLVRAGNYLWNAGIFVFRGDAMLEHLARLAPEVTAGLERIAAAPDRLSELYPELPAISIDYAVMEKLEDLLAVPTVCGWSDLGSWEALAEELARDEEGNASAGEVIAIDARDNVLFAERGAVAVLGVEGLVVVATGDAVLVVPRGRAQEVRRIVDELERRGAEELL